MKIWILNAYDKIPGEQWGYKHSMFLAETLANRGIEVTYWATNYSHATKEFRCEGWGELKVGSNIRIFMVPIVAYQKHISLKRIKALLDYALGTWKRGKKEASPDFIIFCAPAPFVDYVSVKLSKFHKAKLITDFRDLWPELFALAFPKPLRRFSKIILAPLYLLRWYAFSNSHAFTAVCETYLNLAKKISKNVKVIPSEVIYSTGVILKDFEEMIESSDLYDKIVSKREGDIWAIYAGTIGNNYDIPCLMEAARILANKKEAISLKIIVAGDGPLRESLVKFIERNNLGNITYVGALNMPELCRYYAKSDIGLSIYDKGSTVAIPAKAFDYYAAKLPIINSVNGEFAEFLARENIGLNYEAGNPNSLVDALLQMFYKTKEERIDMKNRLNEIAPLYDCEGQYNKIFNIIDKLSNNKGG